MTYEAPQWRSYDINTVNWSLLWSPCGYRVKLGFFFFSDRNIWDFLFFWAAVSWYIYIYISPFLQRKRTVQDTRSCIKGNHDLCKVWLQHTILNDPVVSILNILSGIYWSLSVKANSPKHSPSVTGFPAAVAPLKLSNCRFSSAWQKCFFLPISPFSEG